MKRIKVGDLYFGESEGSEEFKNKERIYNLYFMNIRTNDFRDLLNGRKRYIHGYKGTGKTSLIKALEEEAKVNKIGYVLLSYRTLRNDIGFISEFRKRFDLVRAGLNEEEDQDTLTLTFWKWYLLSLVANEYLNANPLDLIYNTSQKLFRSVASLLDMIIFTFNPERGEFSLSFDSSEMTDNESMIDISRKIHKLQKNIKTNLKEKVIIFIDELELSKARSTYGIDRVMIKNLILATKELNDLTESLHIVLAVRDEVIYNLRGDEINKLRDDFGVSMSWWTRSRITVDHNLWRLIFKKIRYSMEKSGENPEIYSDKQLWDRWFPFKIDNKESWKFFFELTWARPRDFVRLLKLMQSNASELDSFTRDAYNKSIASYSQSTYSEIKEELSTLFDDDTMKKVERTVQELGSNFLGDQFIEIANKHKIDSPETVLEEMYRVGFIGNHYLASESKVVWKFFYRNDLHSERDKPYEVHRALQVALGITNKFNRDIYYGSQDKNIHDKYTNKNYNNDDDDDMIWSL
jgi:hypothetical protein